MDSAVSSYELTVGNVFFNLLLRRDVSDAGEAKRRPEEAVDKGRTGEAMSPYSDSTLSMSFHGLTPQNCNF